MSVSVFDLFTLGIGPSSSHTVGPMRAAKSFVERLVTHGALAEVVGIRVELYGSLAHTGKGHGTDKAILMGLEGEAPESIDPARVVGRFEAIERDRRLTPPGRESLEFDLSRDLVFNYREQLPHHPNGMRFTALGAGGEPILETVSYSVGGGFVVDQEAAESDQIVDHHTPLPLAFGSGDELLEICRERDMAIWEVMMANERVWRDDAEIRSGLLSIAEAMRQCIEAGCRNGGILPGGLKVRRRAPDLYRQLNEGEEASADPLSILDWVSLFAIAVNEENAAGGRVVTAPTNGAAGIIPAVLEYYRRFDANASEDGIVQFLLTAASVGILCKLNASISGAEVGCQGEVGVACSMAAAGLTAVQGGTPQQVENAAEIGIEHHLGMTCDPIGGLVQIPCIERNAMGTTKAISASRMALKGDGLHNVSLDEAIETMRQTGADMQSKYKETSQGGLAINVIEC